MDKEQLALEVVVEGFRQFMREMDAMDRKIGKTGKEFDDTGRKSSGFNKGLGTLAKGGLALVASAALAAVAALALVGTAVVGGIGTAIEFESAFTGVIKTVDGVTDAAGNLTQQGEDLKGELRGLATEIPVAFQDIAGIAELGGQLGVATEDIVSFTDTIAKVGVTTNLSTEEAATSFAQLANIMGSSQDDVTRLASSVVHLGNNLATTEADIVNFSSRIAGAGAIAGLSEADVAGIAGAFSSVGIQAEAGGTAVQKVLLGINTAVVEGGADLEAYAQSAGMSAEDFAKAWEEDAAGAFTSFVDGLGGAGDEAILMLQDLGLTDQRLIRSFLSLAGAGDLLTESIDMSNEAFAENTALTTEAETRFATTESQIQLMKNTFAEISAIIGEAFLPVLNQIITAVRDFVAANKDEFIAVMEQVSTFISETLVPNLLILWEWIQDKLPGAIEENASVWQERFAPLLEQVSILINESLVPALLWLWDIFLNYIFPVVVQLTEIYLVLMIEYWTMLMTIINENVIPALIWLWEVFEQNVLPIIVEFVDYLIEDVFPALDKVWKFIDENFTPVFEALGKVIDELIRLGLEVLVGWWNEEVLPAMEGVWKFLTEEFIPGFEALDLFLTKTLFPGLETAEGKMGALEKAINFVKDAAKSLVTWLGNIADKLASISIPDQLKAQSPPKFAKGLDFVTESARNLVTNGLTELNQEFRALNTVVPALGATTGTTVSNSSETNFNLTTNTTASSATVEQDFMMMEMGRK